MRSAQKGHRRPKKPLLFLSGSIIIRVIFLVRFDWRMITLLVVKLALLQLIREVNVHGLEAKTR